MLKLLKCDLKYLSRTFLPLCGFSVVCCLLLTLIDDKEQHYLWVFPAKNIFLLMLFAASLVLPIMLFFKRALGGQAYFFMSAAIPPRRHIQCRLLSGMLCTSVTYAIVAALDAFCEAYYHQEEYALVSIGVDLGDFLCRLMIILFLQCFMFFNAIVSTRFKRKKVMLTAFFAAFSLMLVSCAYLKYIGFSRRLVRDLEYSDYLGAVFFAAAAVVFYILSTIVFHKKFELDDV